jgi:hypothetical protein
MVLGRRQNCFYRRYSMLVRKARGSWVTSKKDPSKKIYFMEAYGEAVMRFKAIYMYVDGKKKLIRVIGSFVKDDQKVIRTMAEEMIKTKKA